MQQTPQQVSYLFNIQIHFIHAIIKQLLSVFFFNLGVSKSFNPYENNRSSANATDSAVALPQQW